MSTSFSQRHGYAVENVEITVREDATDDLRYGIAEMAQSAGMSPKSIRSVICRVLLIAPNRNNWSDYPNVWEEVLGLLESCEWYKVYDIAEAIWRALEHDFERQKLFEGELNHFFHEKGIGWELSDPDGIVFRGSDARVKPAHDDGESGWALKNKSEADLLVTSTYPSSFFNSALNSGAMSSRASA